MTCEIFDSNYFNDYTDLKLIESFNKEVWNNWWASARAEFLSLLHAEFDNRGFDYSKIWDSKSLSFKNKIKLDWNKIEIL